MNPMLFKMLGLSEEDLKKLQEYIQQLKKTQEQIEEIYNIVEDNHMLLMEIIKNIKGVE